MINLKEFENWSIAQGSVGNPTPEESYKGECVSLVQQYLDKVHGIPFKARGNAKDWANIVIEGFNRYAPDNTPKPGDILVYTWGQYGHLAIVTAEGKSLEQNKNGNRVITVSEITPGYVMIHRPAHIDLGINEETKTIDELAQEVIAGKYGVGQARKEALGDKYNEVQNRVNEILLGKPADNKKSNEEIAKEVIKGDWGNGAERKERLEAEGYNYNEVQKIVNNMLK